MSSAIPTGDDGKNHDQRSMQGKDDHARQSPVVIEEYAETVQPLGTVSTAADASSKSDKNTTSNLTASEPRVEPVSEAQVAGIEADTARLAKPETFQAKKLNSINSRNEEMEKSLASQRKAKASLLAHYSELLSRSSEPVSGRTNLTIEETDEVLLKNARGRIKEHIALLHQYNEIRDVGLGLMGMVAEQRAVRLRDVQEEFGVTPKD